MKDISGKSISRRNWLGQVTTVSLCTGLLAAAPDAFGAVTGRKNEDTGKNRGASIFNIRDFGAKGDGKSLDTAAIQAAIDACHRDQGGTVMVPAGVFLTGTLELKSNVTLHIAAQGTLSGSARGKDYYAAVAIPLEGDATLEDGNTGLIFAVNADNIRIEGTGIIDGQGAQFRSPAKNIPPPAGISGSRRPYHLLFYRCNNLSIQDIFLKDSAFHSVRVIQSDYVKMRGLRIHSRVIHNNDGFHFISCKYVHVTNCDVRSQDDACALFGSCKFITVSNCSFSTRWSVFRFGGGVAENITISDCLIYETYGCPIKLRCGPGSRFENISFSNIIMKDVTGPISIGLGPQGHSSNKGEAPHGLVRNISFSNIRATVVKPGLLPDSEFQSSYRPGEMLSCVVLNAMDDLYLEDISFSNVHITFPGGGTVEEGAVRDVPKIAGEYFEIGTPPAYGLYVRNVRALTLQNIRLELTNPDFRPAVIFDHVEDAALNGMSIQGQKEAESVMRFIETKDTLLSATRVLNEAKVFLQVEGAGSRNIKIDGGDLTKVGIVTAFQAGAGRQSVKQAG